MALAIGRSTASACSGREADAAIEHGAQRLALEQLHDDVGVAAVGLAWIEDAHDGRVSEPRRRPRLAHDALDDDGQAHLGVNELDGHAGLEAPC